MTEEPRTGMPVDKSGGPTVDPTQNVLDLVLAAVKRIDDLREAETRRVNDLRLAESRRVDEQAELRTNYGEKLREAEAKRIDAIRVVDVNAVAVASERAAAQATVLATQVSQSAEALRALVASTAATFAQQSQNTAQQLTDRIALLEKVQYETTGRSGVSNPLEATRFDAITNTLEALSKEIGSLRESRSEGGGKSAGIQASWGILLGVVGLLGGLIGLFAFFAR